MPRVSFSFRGWVSAADIEKVTTVDGTEIDVSQLDPHEVAAKLESNEWLVSLSDQLGNNKSEEIEIFDFEAVD